MSRGFFAESLVQQEAPNNSLLPRCGACGLFKGCMSPKMPHRGRGDRKVLIVGEAPGQNEDEAGKQFVGKAGQFLQKTLEEIGVDLRKDCWTTNALICRPPNNKITNKKMIDYCRPNLTRTIKELQPDVIIPLGGSAVRSLIGGIWKENPGAVSRWVGWDIPSQEPNAWICPTYHPSFLLREHDPIKDLYFKRHLEAAFVHTAKPWTELPNWEAQVEVILDVDEAARIIDSFTSEGGLCAFDYENTALKPEYAGAEILCASICWKGKRTIAFPWFGAVIAAVQRFVRAHEIRLIASNLKHEERWTRKTFGAGVRTWAWDTMIAAHVLDNRPGISGLKFQAFVMLGAQSYDDHIKRFLKGIKGQHTNLAKREIDLSQLLRYCAIDSLLEYLLAKAQQRKFEERSQLVMV